MVKVLLVVARTSRKDSTHDRTAGLARGSVRVWCKVCLVGKVKHTLVLGAWHGSPLVWDTRFSLLDWVRVAGLSCTNKGVWYIYDWDTG